MRKRLTSILLAAALVMTSADFSVLAAEQTTEVATETATASETQETQPVEETEEEKEGETSQPSETESDEGEDEETKDSEAETESSMKETSKTETEMPETASSETEETTSGQTSDESEERQEESGGTGTETENETESETETVETTTESDADENMDIMLYAEEQVNEVTAQTSSNDLNETVKNKILSFKSKYTENSVWGYVFNGWYLCCGFALQLSSEIFGGHWPRTLRSAGNGAVSDGWTCYWVNASNCNSFTVEPGDIIDCPTGAARGKSHTAVVLSVDGGKITCVQANNGGNNQVYWTKYFNYYSDTATIAQIYNKYSMYMNPAADIEKKLCVWKPSEEMKRNAMGIAPEPHACDFSGSLTVETVDGVSVNNGDTLYNRLLRFRYNGYDYYGIDYMTLYYDYNDSLYIADWTRNLENGVMEVTVPPGDGQYEFSMEFSCKNAKKHYLGWFKLIYCADGIIPTVRNVTVTNTGSELYFNADAADDTGITEAWMVARGDDGKEHRFAATVSGDKISGAWSAGYFIASNKKVKKP